MKLPGQGTLSSVFAIAKPASLGAALVAPLVLLGGCGGSNERGSATGATPGSIQAYAGDSGNGSKLYVVDDNSGGAATSLRLLRIRWGRLGNVYASDDATSPQFRDFVVDEASTTDNIDYRVTLNPLTDEFRIDILHPSTSPEFKDALERLQANLVEVSDKSLSPSELPPFPVVPRNAAIMLDFNDLLDPATISAQTIELLVGYPPVTPFDARVMPDYTHGDLADFDGQPGLEFYSTRVIIDTTVSTTEAAQTQPPLPVNVIGLPASLTQNQPNVAIRIATRIDTPSGQLTILSNPTDHSMSLSNNGSVDTGSVTDDVVRAIRSGGDASQTGDINNGFLLDNFKPAVVGIQPVTVLSVEPVPEDADLIRLGLRFNIDACANRLKVGDAIEDGAGIQLEVVCPPGSSCSDGLATSVPIGGLLGNVYARVISGAPSPNQALQLKVRFDPVLYTESQYPCFVRFTSLQQPPASLVSPTTQVVVRFSEPIDPASMTPFDSMTIVRGGLALLTLRDYVVGQINPATNLQEFTFVPTLPLAHTAPTAESYLLTLLGSTEGPTDLAGNVLEQTLAPIAFTLDPNASNQSTRQVALRFDTDDEGSGALPAPGPGVDGFPELRGQFLVDFLLEQIRPRPVVRYAAVADRTQLVPSAMPPFTQGVQTPLSSLGSKMQTVWRYFDVGFSLTDEANFNVDVEGMAWSPVGGTALADTYSRFEMSLSHSLRLPDEAVDSALLVILPNSGLVKTYAQNVFDAANDPPRTVHPGTAGVLGYNVEPSSVFVSDTGTPMLPWPMNRGIPVKDYTYYTWRDTSLLNRGGPQGSGVDPDVLKVALGTCGAAFAPCSNATDYYLVNEVRTIGLPILMEFRCYPDDGALGLNAFDISLATASSPRPNHRAFSTGGLDAGGQQVLKNPDLEPEATGGFNPVSTPPGLPTSGVDNTFYLGQLDLVTRVSRAYSIWFDSNSTSTIYAAPVIEPRASDQPQGTQVRIDFRGASNVSTATAGLGGNLLSNAGLIDGYGDITPQQQAPVPAAPTFFNNDATWKSSISQINSAKFFQFRLTFISNAESSLVPSVSALGIAFRN